MRTSSLATALLLGAAALAPHAAKAADAPTTTPAAADQVIVPTVDRRDVALPKIPSNDFEIGAFAGAYATQNFGTSAVAGARLGYHITEDVFVEGVYAQTTVSDKTYRNILPGGGIFPTENVTLSYYNLSAGYNVLPGEVFIGGKRAKPSAFYLIGGVGSTKFNDQRRPTFNLGAGLRVFLSDNFALQVDARDHIFSLDLLGTRQSTQNLELTFGLTGFF